MTRVLIVASTATMRAGLRALLTSPELQIAGDTPTLSDPSIELSTIDVVIVAEDALLRDAAHVIPADGRCAIALLADDVGAVPTLRRLPLRGWGIVGADTTAPELDAVVRAVTQGLIVLPLQIADRLLGQRFDIEEGSEPLTPREHEVLNWLSQGLPNKLIARKLQISEHTVKFHISSIYTKLGASSRTDAISRGARRGLITL